MLSHMQDPHLLSKELVAVSAQELVCKRYDPCPLM